MNETGTKRACDVCGQQLVVTTGGSGDLVCHGESMKVVAGAGASETRRSRSGDPAMVDQDDDDPFFS